MSKKTRAPLEKLERTIAVRAANPNEKSYTSQLLAGGVEKIGAKVTEEAAEVVEAAAEPGEAGQEHFIREVGDLVYHLLVLMRFREQTLADLETELARRFGVSGLAEKALRNVAPSTPTSPKPKATRSVKRPKKKAKTAKTSTRPNAKSKVKAKR
jgi:phosphoribosyl-ATP pyrophosphohydrolase